MENIVESQGYVTNYDICFICQEEYNNGLICPANIKRSDKNVGYRNLASLKAFERKRTLPTDIKNRITNTDKETLFTLLTENNAKYHKVCRNRYDKQKVDRPKRKNDNDDGVDISLTNSPGTRATYRCHYARTG